MKGVILIGRILNMVIKKINLFKKMQNFNMYNKS